MNSSSRGGERRSAIVGPEPDRQRSGKRGRRWEAIVEGGLVRPGGVNLNSCSAVSYAEQTVLATRRQERDTHPKSLRW